MAEGIAFGLAVKVLTELGSRAIQELGSAMGVKKELKKLERTLSTIKAVLLHAEELEVRQPEVREWLRRIKDAVYEADDIIDDFAIEALRKRLVMQDSIVNMVPYFFLSSNPIAYRFKISRKIRDIRESLTEIQADRSFQLDTRVEETRVRNAERENTHSHVDESKVFGRDVEKEEIVKLLLDLSGEGNLSIIPIYGMAGLGKTTLAQLVYKDERVDRTFNLKLWVCVGEDFDVKKITEKTIKSATNSECPNLEMDQLQSRLREQLKGKRFLLVLDDVWNENGEKWNNLKDLLLGGEMGSKIIVTTRSEKVAVIMGSVSQYKLLRLSEDDCWELFKQRAFGSDQKQGKPNLVEIGKGIVRKCGGVPLAAKALGSLMRFKTEEHEWTSIKDSDLWRLPLEEVGILPALRISYNHLPFYLRQCFSFCAIFPKGWRIAKQELILLWVAQGFVHTLGENQILEDIGNVYVKDLMWRSFFQEAKLGYLGEIRTLKMHDLVHDLAQSVAGTEYFIAGKETKGDIPNGVRHLRCVGEDLPVEFPESLRKHTNLRTLLFNLKLSLTEDILSSFKCLRVLSLLVETGEVPSSIGKLKHLRYLEIESDSVTTVPNSITKLQSLETLSLLCSKITLLPGEIWKLQKLKHIYTHKDTVLTYMPSGLSHLTSIQMLEDFFVGKGIGCKLNELNGLIHLKGQLKIFDLENVSSARDCVEANLKGKHNLVRLHLVWNDEGVNRVKIDFDVLGNLEPHRNLKVLAIQGYRDNRFPRWMTDPLLPNLVLISLKQCRNCQNLPALGQLPSLKEVQLEELDTLQFIEGGSVVRRQREWFPSLEKIFLFANPNLESWVKEEEEEVSLHSVVVLSVRNCPKLSTMPMLPSLEDLIIEKCSEKLMLSLLKVNPEKNAPTSSLPNSSSLANLKYLDISSCDDLLSLSEDGLQNLASLETLNIKFCPRIASLPEQGLGGLTSLVSLKISDCESLASLSGMRYLTALQNLHLARCEKMHILEDDMDGLTSLCTLEIRKIPNLVSIPKGLQNATALKEFIIFDCESLLHAFPEGILLPTTLEKLWIVKCDSLMSWPNGLGNLTSLVDLWISCSRKLQSLPEEMRHLTALKNLTIGGWDGLMTLPEWLKSFTSLRVLQIYYFPNLLCVPDWIHCLTALRKLWISQCDALTTRCQKDTGEDWHKIAHIPEVKVSSLDIVSIITLLQVVRCFMD